MNQTVLSEEQKKTLTELGVQALYLFGSRALGTETEISDYDYAVLMKDERHRRGDDLYEHLYDILSTISPRTLKNDVIDIIYLRDVGLELKFHVIRYGKILFESNVLERLRFEERTTNLYCDYRPILDQFDKAILESL
ncbi:MAG: nucleotidyltransferase domain-containing protein [Deltaproteobacteria bacterium]|nr:MAG: nucleotidyltransferase domain-containing protein [Deltaproteobacteria bacterium]